MNKLVKNIILIIYICLFNNSVFGLSSIWNEGEVSKVRIISPLTHNNNQDQLFLGLEYKMESGWKTYWQSPGDGGFAQSLDWKNSTNVENVKIQWPSPKEFEILGLTSIGYEEEVIFPVSIKLKDKNKITNLDFFINYLVCKDICIPGTARVFLDIPSGIANTTEYFYVLEKTISNLPQTKIELSSITKFKTKAIKDDDNILIEISATTNEKFQSPKIYLHTPYGLPISNPLINYSLDYKTLTALFKFNKKLFNNNQIPLEAILIDENHNFSFNEKIKIEESKKFNFSKISHFYFIF
jgi:Uncharacterized protein predicted to be involved in C-type cytochrome biogenesis